MFKKTVDSILSSINKNISDLRSFAEVERDAATKEQEKAKDLLTSASSRSLEAIRADTVAARLADLVK